MSNGFFMARIRGFLRQQSGVALIEFAFVFPIMLLLIFAGIELTRYIIINQKLEKAAYELTNIVAQYKPATSAKANGEISQEALKNDVFPLFDRMMSPYNRPDRMAFAVTSIIHQDGTNLVRWRISSVFTGNHRMSADPAHTGAGVNSIVNGLNMLNLSPQPIKITDYPRVPPGICGEVTWSGPAAGSYIATAFTDAQGAKEGENTIIGEAFFYYEPLYQRLGRLIGFKLNGITLSRRIFLYPRNGDLLILPSSTDPTTDQALPPNDDMAQAKCPD